MSDRELEALTKELDRMRRENAALRAMAASEVRDVFGNAVRKAEL